MHHNFPRRESIWRSIYAVRSTSCRKKQTPKLVPFLFQAQFISTSRKQLEKRNVTECHPTRERKKVFWRHEHKRSSLGSATPSPTHNSGNTLYIRIVVSNSFSLFKSYPLMASSKKISLAYLFHYYHTYNFYNYYWCSSHVLSFIHACYLVGISLC